MKRLSATFRTIAAAGLALGAMSLAAPAHAAAGDPFDPGQAKVFIAQVAGATTKLLIGTTDGSGSGGYTQEGGVAPLGYNSIAFNTADNYIYGIVTNASTSGPSIPVGALVRVGQDNVVTRVGTGTFGTASNTGVFGPDGYLYVANANTEGSLRVIDTATGALVRTQALESVPVVSDLTLQGGFLWGVQNSTRTLVRIDPITGDVDRFTNVLPSATIAGSAWTYGNGNIGVKNNDPGVLYQIKITDPGSATPTFTLVSSATFPATPGSDGTAIPGPPPTVTVTTPAPGAVYEVGSTVTVDFSCGPTAVGCEGTLPDGAPLDTSAPGDFVFEVKATDATGQVTIETVEYSVAEVVGTPMIDPEVGLAVAAVALLVGGIVVRRRAVA